VQCTSAKEGATQTQQALEAKLVGTLRVAQAAARQKHTFTDPTKLQDYHIGERIDASRPVLQQCAEGIIGKADAERPPGIDTQFVQQAKEDLNAYVQSGTDQTTEQGRAKAERAQRDALVESITQRRRLIQFAADGAWPASVPANAAARLLFRLPANQPYKG
jgi:hypothetical protein